MNRPPILSVENLSTVFQIPRGGLFSGTLPLRAVNEVSFGLYERETLGIVGESGCGKSTLGRSILRLIEPTAGRVIWQGADLGALSDEDMRKARRNLQIIFQDPIASLDPRMTIGDTIAEPLRVFEPGLNRSARQERVLDMMDAVGLLPEMLNRYPHEFSGGQAQRIGIARALVSRPQLIVCDEPVSALDVSIQAQIINLLRSLKAEFGLTLIFISHDLSVMRLISDRVMVLYLGQIMELTDKAMLFEHPAHPYTQALLSAAPVPDPVSARRQERIVLKGDPPSPINPIAGCPFQTRCPIVQDLCRSEKPALEDLSLRHQVACHFPTLDGKKMGAP